MKLKLGLLIIRIGLFVMGYTEQEFLDLAIKLAIQQIEKEKPLKD